MAESSLNHSHSLWGFSMVVTDYEHVALQLTVCVSASRKGTDSIILSFNFLSLWEEGICHAVWIDICCLPSTLPAFYQIYDQFHRTTYSLKFYSDKHQLIIT